MFGENRSKSSGRIIQEMESWEIAREMIRRGVRPPTVHAATNLSRDSLRDMWQTEHNTRPPCGQLKDSSLTCIRRLRQSAHATFFFRCYSSYAGEEMYSTVDNSKVLKAHDLYLKLLGDKEPVIDFTLAWLIARDIRIKTLQRKYCPTCQMDHLYSVENKMLHNCPFCRTYKLGLDKRRASRVSQKNG